MKILTKRKDVTSLSKGQWKNEPSMDASNRIVCWAANSKVSLEASDHGFNVTLHVFVQQYSVL